MQAESSTSKGTSVSQSTYDPNVCISCGATGATSIFDGPIVPVVKCDTCGLMRQGRRTTEHVSSSVQYSGGLDRLHRQRLDKEEAQLADYKPVAGELEKLLGKPGRLLEIGSATGALLSDIRGRGWDVLGIESADWSSEIAREKYGLEIVNEYFQHANIEANSMDAVVMFHVIEHLPDPVDGLKVIWDMIKPGGYLVMETPRYDTIWFKLLKGRERSVIPGHLYYFTRDSLTEIAERVGFKVERLDSVGRTLTADRLCYSVSKVVNWGPATRGLTRFSDRMQLRKYKMHINTRDMMRFYLQKPLLTK